MRSRLEALGAPGVRARTFHSAALAQLRHFRPESVGKIVASKALALRQIGNTLPMPYKFRPAGRPRDRDRVGEEPAPAARALPRRARRPRAADPRRPHAPRLRALRGRQGGARRRRLRGPARADGAVVRAGRAGARDRARALPRVHGRRVPGREPAAADAARALGRRARRPLRRRRRLSVHLRVHRSVAAASARDADALPARGRDPLEENYRSSTQILELANKLVPKLGGAAKTLRATQPEGPQPELAQCVEETEFVVARIRALGVTHEQIAILCRTNARLADFEEALQHGRHPVAGCLVPLARERAVRAAQASVRRRTCGGSPRTTAGWSIRRTSWASARWCARTTSDDSCAWRRSSPTWTARAFVAELERRFGVGGDSRRGVHLLTLHGAKGLEFEAVFVAHVEEKELPSRLAKTPAEIAEERRLFYVGLTRAKRHLFVTWTHKPSRFLGELGVQRPAFRAPLDGEPDDPVFAELKKWRLERSRADGVPAYVVFHNSALAEIARPQAADAARPRRGAGRRAREARPLRRRSPVSAL